MKMDSDSNSNNSDAMEMPGLSQSDFRKLLSQTTNTQKRQKRTRQQKDKEKQPMQPARKRYRDRAAERRGGIDENGHEASSMTYEESKFLGGDIERTHLVKGLDYLLLEKNRTKENDSGGGPENTAPENKANTELGQRVLLTACRFRQSLSDHDNSNVEPNDLFAPGRMYFEFDTSASCAITVHIRSQEEIAHYLEITSARASTTIPESDWLVLSKVIAAIAKPTMAVPDKAPTETSNQQRENIPVVVDNEDDIFEDAGV